MHTLHQTGYSLLAVNCKVEDLFGRLCSCQAGKLAKLICGVHSGVQPQKTGLVVLLVAVQGVINKETRFTCTACAGTLLLEFGTLSRLTGNPIYEQQASHAVKQVFGEPQTLLGVAVLWHDMPMVCLH